MKGLPVDQLVYEYMFPKPRPADPPNFQVLLQQKLVVEVRHEVHAFYGHLDTPEAKYPGLDYCHPTHRMRLSRWQWHRRLFRAFDALRLTPNEIASLTKWEGTKWAKDRYEKEQGITIRDTTADDFSDWIPPHERRAPEPHPAMQASGEPGESVDETMAEDSDEELASVGVDLNERLRERVAARNVSGDLSMTLDEEWEQWLKNAMETGELPDLADQIARAHGVSPGAASLTPGMFPSRMLTAARSGNWREIPDFLRPMIRQVLALDSESSTLPSPLSIVSPAARVVRRTPTSDTSAASTRPPQHARRGGRASMRVHRIAATPSQSLGRPSYLPSNFFPDADPGAVQTLLTETQQQLQLMQAGQHQMQLQMQQQMQGMQAQRRQALIDEERGVDAETGLDEEALDQPLRTQMEARTQGLQAHGTRGQRAQTDEQRARYASRHDSD